MMLPMSGKQNLWVLTCNRDEHPVWDQIGHYLGVACANLTLTLSLEKIVLGGGVMNRTILYEKIRTHFTESLCGYL